MTPKEKSELARLIQKVDQFGPVVDMDNQQWILNLTATIRLVRLLLKQTAELEGDLAEYLDDAFRQIAHREEDGWWDTMALSTATGLGDRLCEMGLWEVRPGNLGRRQWFRPVDTEPKKGPE